MAANYTTHTWCFMSFKTERWLAGISDICLLFIDIFDAYCRRYWVITGGICWYHKKQGFNYLAFFTLLIIFKTGGAVDLHKNRVSVTLLQHILTLGSGHELNCWSRWWEKRLTVWCQLYVHWFWYFGITINISTILCLLSTVRTLLEEQLPCAGPDVAGWVKESEHWRQQDS